MVNAAPGVTISADPAPAPNAKQICPFFPESSFYGKIEQDRRKSFSSIVETQDVERAA